MTQSNLLQAEISGKPILKALRISVMHMPGYTYSLLTIFHFGIL